jgi:tetratricopeptide (TPR) repeat protein
MNNHADPSGDRLARAQALEARGEYLEALKLWRTLASDSKDAIILCQQARTARQLGFDTEAERAFRAAIRADRSLPGAYTGLAILLRAQGDALQAVELLVKASTLERSAGISTLLGAALVDLGRLDEAANAFQTALRIEPTYEEAYFNLAMLKTSTDAQQAEALFLKAIELDPDYIFAHRELGTLLNKSEPSAQAEYHLRRALKLDPSDLWARVHLGNLLWLRGDMSAGLVEFEQAAERHPDAAIPVCCIANVYENQELWEEAEALYERALTIEPDDSVVHMNYGRMLKRKGDKTAAETHLRAALLLDPDYEAARKLLDELSQF